MMSRTGSKSKLASATRGKKDNVPEESEEDTEPEVPQLAWSILSEKNTRELKSLTVEGVAKRLATILSFNHHEDCLKEAAQLDYYVAGYWFAAREKNLSDEQTSAFFTLLHRLLDNVKTKQLSLSDNIKELQQHMTGVGVPNSRSALKCFTTDEAVITIQYFHSTLFQHYRLFEYLFTETQEEETIRSKLYVEVPPDPSSLSPPPLEEAVSLEFYERCLAPKPSPQPEPDKEQTTADTPAMQDEEGTLITADDPLMNVSVEELKSVMESMTKSTFIAYQAEVSEKLKQKEEAIMNQISTLEKNLNL